MKAGPITDWTQVPLTADIATTARVLGRSVRSIEEDLARGCMQPAPMPTLGAGRTKQRRQWSKDALQAWLGGGYLRFVQQAQRPKARHFFGTARARAIGA